MLAMVSFTVKETIASIFWSALDGFLEYIFSNMDKLPTITENNTDQLKFNKEQNLAVINQEVCFGKFTAALTEIQTYNTMMKTEQQTCNEKVIVYYTSCDKLASE